MFLVLTLGLALIITLGWCVLSSLIEALSAIEQKRWWLAAAFIGCAAMGIYAFIDAFGK